MKEFIPGQLIVAKRPCQWGTMPDPRPLLLVTAAERALGSPSRGGVEAWWVTVIYSNPYQPRGPILLEPKYWEEVETHQ